MACELCEAAGGETVWAGPTARVVLVDDAAHPGFCRVIATAHVAEMTDLDAADRRELMDLVFSVESVLRKMLPVDKINLASLGNRVPHLHWHVIPRYRVDPEYPSPIWAAPVREPAGLPASPTPAALRDELARAIGRRA